MNSFNYVYGVGMEQTHRIEYSSKNRGFSVSSPAVFDNFNEAKERALCKAAQYAKDGWKWYRVEIRTKSAKTGELVTVWRKVLH